MPEGTSNGSADAASGESRGAKRARLAFNRDDMDLDPVKTPEYARWERWRDHAAPTAYGFLDSADAGIMAAQYQERLMEDGLSVAGVDRAVEWAGGGLDAPTALIYMALFERSSNLRLDVEAAAWRAAPQPSPPAREQPEEPLRDHQSQEPKETAEQAEIRRPEARIRELQLPKVPPLSEGELTKIASGQHPWLWQQELIQALNTWIKTEDPIGKANTLVETVWKVVYRDSQPAPTHRAGAAARPAPQGWYAQAQQPAPQQAQTQPSAQAQTPALGPPGACFRCGMHGHWARDCASGGQVRARSVAGSVAGSYRGGFSTVGSQSLYTAHSTGRTYDATAPPPRTRVFGAAATTRPWAARARHRLPRPPSPFRPGRPQRRPTDEGPSASGGERPASEDSPMTRGAEHSTCVTRGRQWTAYGGAITWRSPSRWPSGGGPRVPWSGGPRSSGMWAGSRRTGPSWTQRGHCPSTSSGAPPWASRLGHCEASYLPSAWQRNWAAYHPQCGPSTGSWHEAPRPPPLRHDRPKWVTLRLMARNIRTTLDWFCLGLAVISFTALLRVGEAASVRPVDIRTRCTLGFFDDKKVDEWVTVRLGAWPDAWRAAVAAHPWVSSRPASVPLMAAAFDLQAAIHGLLAATGWESMGWHAWRRGGAAAMRAFGAAIASIAVAGRWDNEAEAHRYASAPPGWEFFLPDNVPWPTAGFGAEIRPVHGYQLWALGTLGPRGPDGTDTALAQPDVRAGDHGGQGAGLRGDSYMRDTIVLGSSRDESPDTVARRAARHPRESQRKAHVHRTVARGQSAPAARATRAAPAPKPQPKQAAGGAADRRAAAAPRSAAVPRVTPARASTRGTQAPGGAPARRRSGAAGDAASGCPVR